MYREGLRVEQVRKQHQAELLRIPHVVATGSWLVNSHVDLLVEIDEEENLTEVNIKVPPKVDGIPVDIVPVLADSSLRTRRR